EGSQDVTRRMTRGEVDIVIGTHRLLSRDATFHDLGLLIVDEEHRFGVRHKERLKALKLAVDVLTLTATPIPRTLHLSLAGLRDLTLLETPPKDRSPVLTFIEPWDDALIEEALARELDRAGQVYFVHNRIETIDTIAERVRALAPPRALLSARARSRRWGSGGTAAGVGASHGAGRRLSHRAARSGAARRREPARRRTIGSCAGRRVRRLSAMAAGDRRRAEGGWRSGHGERRAAGSGARSSGTSPGRLRRRRGGEARSVPAAGASRAAVRDSNRARGTARSLRPSPG